MIEIYQNSWFDINFKDFCNPSIDQLADENFYNKFYGEFYKKFSSYGDLPEAYQASKTKVAEEILSHFEGDTILSIGSGNGFIENILTEHIAKVIAVEPSKQAATWLLKNSKVECYSGFFPQVLPEQLQGQITQAYSVGVDYVFDTQQYTQFLKSIVDFGIKNYCMYQATLYTAATAPKLFVRMLLIKAGLFRKNDFQLWGLMRSQSETIACFKDAGFEKVLLGQLDDGTWWVRGRTGD